MSDPAVRTEEARPHANRFAGAGMIFAGRTFLTLALMFGAVLLWLEPPGGPSLLRLAVFGVLGLILALAGYRLASGIWKGAWQLPLQAAGMAGLFFLAVLLKVEAGRYPPTRPPAWVIGVAALAPLSWWLLAPKRRRRKR